MKLNLKIEILRKQLDKLEANINETEIITEAKLITWVTACVIVFTDIGIEKEILNGFLKTFDPIKEKSENVFGDKKVMGPFEGSTFGRNNVLQKSSPEGNLTETTYYARIAFAAARVKLNRWEEEERLVGKSLIRTFEESEETQHIATSLELMEQSFQQRNASALLKEAFTCLDSYVRLHPDPELKGKKLGAIMNKLESDKEVREYFGEISDELIRAVKSAIIPRNLSTHPNILPIKYDVPFQVSVCLSHLIILFIEISIATGQIIKGDSKDVS